MPSGPFGVLGASSDRTDSPMNRTMSRRLRPPLTLLGGIALCAACSTESAPSAGGPNVILVSIDSLRADFVGCYGYRRPTTPFLDSLAESGVRFENAISTTSWTLPSHAAMFTGLNDSTHGLVDNGLSLSDDHVTLAETLARAGYTTAGFFGGPYLHPTFGVGQGFDHYESCMGTTPPDASGQAVRRSAMMPGQAPSHADVTGPRTRDAVKRWAASHDGSPFFLFVHLWDVHYDFLPPEEYRVQFTDPAYDGPADGRLMDNDAIHAGMDPRDLEHVLGLYAAEIRFTDAILAEILADLEERGLLANTLVIVTADHGEEFFEHGGKGHNKTLFDEVLKVPLIVAWPGQLEPRVVAEQVQIIDLFPTITGAVGLERPLVQGRDLGPLLTGTGRDAFTGRDALAELWIDRGSQRALRSNRRKLWQPHAQGPVFSFDLEANPRETFGPEGPPRGDGAELRTFLETKQAFEELLGDRNPDELEMSDEMAAQLQALGYLDGGEDEE